MDIRELILHIRREKSNRGVQRKTHVHRQTVKRYRAWAAAQGLLEGPLPPLAELEQLVQQTLPETPPPQNVSSVEPYRELVSQLRKEGVEVAAILQRMRERGFDGSYSAVRRFVGNLEATAPEAYVRVERTPGEESQIHVGYAGTLINSQTISCVGAQAALKCYPVLRADIHGAAYGWNCATHSAWEVFIVANIALYANPRVVPFCPGFSGTVWRPHRWRNAMRHLTNG